MIKVIIFSDITIYCEGLSRILAAVEPFEVVATESRFTGAIDCVEKLSPDVVLLDMTMAQSCRLAQRMTQQYPDIRIVALAVPEDEQNIFECAQAGLAGYVSRESSLDELIETMRCAAMGEFRCSAKIAACVFNRVQQGRLGAETCQPISVQSSSTPTGQAGAQPASTLTRREQQIIDLMAQGLSNKQIASALFIEVSTVKNHVHNILVKLQVSSRAQVINLLKNQPVGAGSRSSGLDYPAGVSI